MLLRKSNSLLGGLLLGAALTLPVWSNAHAVTNPVAGTLDKAGLWETYKSRFIRNSGRVVDTANKGISHSEGQGFAMIMAVAANDRAAFERIWGFTKSELGVRKDALFAWKWTPRRLVHVRDKNNASDGDILIAWALLEAGEAGFGDGYTKQAYSILKSLRKVFRQDAVYGKIIMPAVFGFTADHHSGRDVVNLSYWVYPAFERIAQITGEKSWLSLRQSGDKLLYHASANRAGLPSDWTTIRRRNGDVSTSAKFGSQFSYNAIRVPLYLAWAGTGSAEPLMRLQKNWVQRPRGLQQVDIKRNRAKGRFDGLGYKAVAAVVDCALDGTAFPANLRTKLDKHYYPASLHLLSVIATKQRYPQCW